MQVGFKNMTAYLQRIVPTFPNAKYVVLVGVSVGGMGAVFNWWQTQQAFAGARVDWIDDSGAILTPDVIPQGDNLFGPATVANWDLNAALPPGCAECPTDLASVYDFFADNYPQSRGALISYTGDSVLPSYYEISSSKFTSGLSELLTSEFAPHTNLQYFTLSGTGHVVLAGSPSITTAGVTIEQFITDMVTNSPTWTSVHP
jgi:hypothetical protein